MNNRIEWFKIVHDKDGKEIKMTENRPMDITDARFEDEVLSVKGISVVDFWAPWCGPCHSMAPGLESFAKANNGRVKVFKLDVDDNPKTAERFEIRSVPTVIFFKDGEVVDTSPKALSETVLQTRLDSLLK
ncbi:thioredoxin [Deltaproteobacteria bacterium]|nr:thioredoxin [Deltaproteobacteria bacterium]